MGNIDSKLKYLEVLIDARGKIVDKDNNIIHSNLITHSFNIEEVDIVDFARLEDPQDPLKSNTLPHTYYGIEVPRAFVLQFESETIKEKSMKPLLYEWYKENK